MATPFASTFLKSLWAAALCTLSLSFANAAENQAAQDRNAVVFLGDSITQRWSGLAAAFPGVKTANRGVDGDTTSGVLRRINDVVALDPKAVVLLIGTNDLEQGVTPEVAAGNLKQILAALEQKNPKMPIVLCQVLPRGDPKAKPAADIQALNMAFLDVVRERAASGRENVTILETSVLYADAKGSPNASDFSDLMHPNAAGYAKLAKALHLVLLPVGVTSEPADRFTPDAGFVSLFNGRDLTGWGYRPTPEAEIAVSKKRDASNKRPPSRVYVDKPVLFDGATVTPEGAYVVKNGSIIVTTPPEHRKIQGLWTAQEFPQNFILKMQCRAAPNADSGVYIRGPQLQVRDYLAAGPYNELKNYRVQDWNDLEITVTGAEAVCKMNGEVLTSTFKVPATGPIGLERDRGQIEYRRIQIKVLP